MPQRRRPLGQDRHHCTDRRRQAAHRAAPRLGLDVAGFLMMAHYEPSGGSGRAGKLMESYGAHCVYVTDSAGALLVTDAQTV